MSVVTVLAVLVLGGCSQNLTQNSGRPVPQTSMPTDRHVSPAPVPPVSAQIIGPGYAPPRTAGPTQTASPNPPGGKV
ncbi:hypothetical protein E7Y31_17940 [Candidatus Frankia alpina]|uniref:Lipoprotein n=1 Tax=Candidatus Frankia alpina TaxID=2699483 RepID=A0A4S5DYD1_9ACTN|nr:hypothetical protein E7Y31_17940 [Candidatus Frankia alpina]